MSERRTPSSPSWQDQVPGILVLLAFVAPGAWLVVTLPPVPVAKALALLTVATWLLAIGVGVVRWRSPDRRVLWALGAVAASVLVSYLLGGSLFQVAFYDLYASMPLLHWLAFPILFLLASGVSWDRKRLEKALVVVVSFGALLAVTEAYQQLVTATPRVFGSTGYSTAALSLLIPVAVVLAASRTGPTALALYGMAAVIALDVGLLAGSTMGMFAVVFAVLVSVAVHPAVRASQRPPLRAFKHVASAVAGLMVCAMLFVQVPAVSAVWVNPETLAAGGPSVVSRLQMWQGAQDMFAERPLFGYGPSGYRMSAVEFLPPEALQFGPDREGSTDPTVYSPQSPHSVLWETGTRLGLFGFVAFVALLGAWAISLYKRVRTKPPDASLRLALAAGFLTAVFALSVDPVFFAVGLLAPVAAGLAVAPPESRGGKGGESRPWATKVFTGLGVVLVPVAIWLGVGEWRAATTWADDPYEALALRQEVLAVLPGHPPTHRQVLEMKLLLASDNNGIVAAQSEVDSAPRYIHDFAPNLVSLASYSLSQAERTARDDLAWEQALLDRAAERIPPVPSLVAEKLRLAVLSGDEAAVEQAVADAERWGSPHPFTDDYLDRAYRVLGSR